LLFLAPNLAQGGAERQWALLVSLLAQRGHNVEVLTIDDTGPFFESLTDAGVRTTCLHASRRTHAVAALPKCIHHAPDVVVSRAPSAQLLGHVVARSAMSAHLTTDHTGVGTAGAIHRRPWRMGQTAIIRLVATRADRVVAVSRAQVPALVQLGYRRDRIEIIPNGIDVSAVKPTTSRSDARRALGIHGDEFLALLVAGLRPEKRVELFVRSIAVARKHEPKIHGFIAGGGPALSSLQAECARIAGNGVVALGGRHDVPNLLNAADVVCLTSAREALPMAILEAMAAGKPVVATDVGGVRDAVREGETGLVVGADGVEPFASSVLRLARDPSRAQQMGFNAKRRVRKCFDLNSMVDAYERVLTQLAVSHQRWRPIGVLGRRKS
jgi:glycosyltransferase involved in cell wall biosynthesis